MTRLGGGGDCTNFASQILLAGGADMEYPDSGWYYYNAVAYSPTWINAGLFADYWAGRAVRTGQSLNLDGLISEVKEGDFIGFLKPDSYEYSHWAYVSKKASGRAYITEHDKKPTPCECRLFAALRYLELKGILPGNPFLYTIFMSEHT
ncbi:amidase domain-containing protein [Lacticaseibacillus jixianensis]|uniref:amidase domain-containing protein n=1 Tax=Lacticaseibacillus jixianensis TaxID=2486012 RepID=UPI001CDC2764|nr:amidase domain-containing protein [Lacticaseibacillus jixianensis]